jgi:mannose-6-phosphate isomerase class I
MSYDPSPSYRVVDGSVEAGYGALAAEVACNRPATLVVDGPAALPWEQIVMSVENALRDGGLTCSTVDARRSFAAWDEVQRRTASSSLPGDPVFGRLFAGDLAGLLDGQPGDEIPTAGDVTVVFGPGSALLSSGTLWYADLPKRHALTAVKSGTAGNLGQPPGAAGSEQRLLFVDWPLLDRHKQALLPRLDRYVDLTDAAAPRSVEGAALRRSLSSLARQPFRVRPTYLPGPWGGQWLRRVLGVPTDAPNLAWSYELITPESGLLLGDGDPLEVGFELLMAGSAEDVLGPEIAHRFGGEFPIRFDYLDTVEGGHLSLQCHPREDYARDVFGLPYTQLESYYVVDTTPGARIFLGLREGADVAEFREQATRAERPGRPLDAERFVQAFPAEQHRLYLIPAGTAHASGAGNLVLEISATPYLYTLRFYDWLRRDLDERLRPVHLEHAFANLDERRRGSAVRRDLIPEPRLLRSRNGSRELVLGAHPELFFAVHRLDFDEAISDDTAGRFHVLNLVEGERVEIEAAAGARHPLSYAETIVVPAAVGPYRIRRVHGPRCKVIKAFVP